MITFALGGFGGAINAAYAMNAMIHNTAWIQGHFHLTVGTAVALSFMGFSYWMLPRVTGRALVWPRVAMVQPYLWFVGMQFFSIPSHIAGLMGMPRRVYTGEFHGNEAAARVDPARQPLGRGRRDPVRLGHVLRRRAPGHDVRDAAWGARRNRVRGADGAAGGRAVNLGPVRALDRGRGRC